MLNANSEISYDFAFIEERLSGVETEFNKYFNGAMNITSEINDYNDDNLHYVRQIFKEYRKYMRSYSENHRKDLSNRIKQKLIDFSTQYTSAIETLIKFAQTDNAKVLALRLKGDFIRYNIEFFEDDKSARGTYIQEALVVYATGLELSKALPIENYNRLGLTLNYSVLLSDEIRDVDLSISILKEALAQIEQYKKDFKDISDPNVDIIRETMKENLAYYEENRELFLAERNKIY